MSSRRQALTRCLVAVLSTIACAGVMIAAALDHAPPAALIVVIALGVVCPMAAASELPEAVALLRWPARIRRRLAELPETQHPLGY